MKRYSPAIMGRYPVMMEDDTGDFVLAKDYNTLHDKAFQQARLIERLRGITRSNCAQSQRSPMDAQPSPLMRSYVNVHVLQQDVSALKAEVERLRKAGDAMHQAAVQDCTGIWLEPAFKAWKETK